MNEVAWCYLEGYGCKKDKVRRAASLRVPDDAREALIVATAAFSSPQHATTDWLTRRETRRWEILGKPRPRRLRLRGGGVLKLTTLAGYGSRNTIRQRSIVVLGPSKFGSVRQHGNILLGPGDAVVCEYDATCTIFPRLRRTTGQYTEQFYLLSSALFFLLSRV